MISALGYSKTLEKPLGCSTKLEKSLGEAQPPEKSLEKSLGEAQPREKSVEKSLGEAQPLENLSKNRSVRLTARKNVQKSLFGTAKLVRDGNKFCFYSPGLGDRGKSQYIYIYIYIYIMKILT